MTGLPAKAPMLPSPKTAVPLVMTAYQIAFARIFIGVERIFHDFEARLRHAGRVGQRKVVLRSEGFGGYYRYFAGLPFCMVTKGFFSHIFILHCVLWV